MKKIIKPHQQEQAVFYSDFTGKCFNEFGPDVNLIITFNYGSKYDGAKLFLDLSDEEAMVVLNLIKSKVSEDTKTQWGKTLKGNTNTLQSFIETREYTESTHISNNCQLLEFLIN